ncbi:MAG TPA: xanthine dehydrogenase family protein subunit M, partial [Pyrinomonadaceae bacterium]|nr:xanthine dehydrogenase family protein subunit M [Pyrinomonadaceae bacterium]
MRAYIPKYRLVSPSTLDEALATLEREPGVWKPFAGGTDLMVLLDAGKLPHTDYLNIWKLSELKGIEVQTDHVKIGALTTYTELQGHPVLREEFPMLCQAARETGGPAIQNRGTLGGNIINASPAADSPPALLAYDASLELAAASSHRTVSYAAFHTGYKQLDLRPDELLTAIRLPRKTNGMVHYYRKVGTRKAQAIAKICFAAVAQCLAGIIHEVRIGVGSVAPTPIRCVRTEALLRGSTLTPALIESATTTLGNEIV